MSHYSFFLAATLIVRTNCELNAVQSLIKASTSWSTVLLNRFVSRCLRDKFLNIYLLFLWKYAEYDVFVPLSAVQKEPRQSVVVSNDRFLADGTDTSMHILSSLHVRIGHYTCQLRQVWAQLRSPIPKKFPQKHQVRPLIPIKPHHKNLRFV